MDNPRKPHKLQNLHKLKQSDYHLGAKLALQNAKNLYESAQKVAELNHYGTASSLLIISVEEIAKASILRIKSLNNSIRIRNLDKYFTNHSVKHDFFVNVYSVLIDYLKANEDIHTDDFLLNKGNSKFNISEAALFFIMLGFVVYFIYLSKGKKIKLDFGFENIRQQGLYMEFDSESKSWKNPNDVFTVEDYKFHQDLVETVFTQINESLFGEHINKKNIIAFAKKLDDEQIITDHIK